VNNIHVLPTDKPSKLYYSNHWEKLYLQNTERRKEEFINIQHIYITSDEEIKEVDWCLDSSNKLFKAHIYSDIYKNLKTCKKVVLTTDQDLIKDGVQAIDDEFLEWFLKNQSCEFVEVVNDTYTVGEMSKLLLGTRNRKYKIIVPKKEEITLEDLYFKNNPNRKNIVEDRINDFTKDLSQETLEEAAEKVVERLEDFDAKRFTKAGFKLGTKWQAERMYSEEDLKKAFYAGSEQILIEETDSGSEFEFVFEDFKQWFEQFKKK